MTYKTPGVYIQEISLFPPSVAQVETAIPAFVGYTEKASDPNDKSLTNTPVRIKSLVEFQSLFGGEYVPASFAVVADATKNNALVTVTPDKRYYLFDALRQFYDNGGGYCYIVSVNSYNDPIAFNDLKKGFDLLRKVDEPTLLLAPDAVGLLDGDDKPDLAKFTDLQKLLLTQCAELQDRFAILDILEGSLPEDVSNKPITNFRNTIGINNLSYGAAYYPWVITSYSYEVIFRQLKLFDKADLNNAVASYDPYAKDDAEKALVANTAASMANTDATLTVSGVQKATLKTGGSSYLKTTLAGYQADIAADTDIVDNITAYLNLLNAIAVSFTKAEAAAQAGSGFKKEIESMQKDSELTAALAFLVAVKKTRRPSPTPMRPGMQPRSRPSIPRSRPPGWPGRPLMVLPPMVLTLPTTRQAASKSSPPSDPAPRKFWAATSAFSTLLCISKKKQEMHSLPGICSLTACAT